MSCFASEKRRDPSSPRLRRDKAYLYPLRLSRRNAMEPDEASAARREIARETPSSVVFYETAVKKDKKTAPFYQKNSAVSITARKISPGKPPSGGA